MAECGSKTLGAAAGVRQNRVQLGCVESGIEILELVSAANLSGATAFIRTARPHLRAPEGLSRCQTWA
jgi:hypothetical protein